MHSKSCWIRFHCRRPPRLPARSRQPQEKNISRGRQFASASWIWCPQKLQLVFETTKSKLYLAVTALEMHDKRNGASTSCWWCSGGSCVACAWNLSVSALQHEETKHAVFQTREFPISLIATKGHKDGLPSILLIVHEQEVIELN